MVHTVTSKENLFLLSYRHSPIVHDQKSVYRSIQKIDLQRHQAYRIAPVAHYFSVSLSAGNVTYFRTFIPPVQGSEI